DTGPHAGDPGRTPSRALAGCGIRASGGGTGPREHAGEQRISHGGSPRESGRKRWPAANDPQTPSVPAARGPPGFGRLGRGLAPEGGRPSPAAGGCHRGRGAIPGNLTTTGRGEAACRAGKDAEASGELSSPFTFHIVPPASVGSGDGVQTFDGADAIPRGAVLYGVVHWPANPQNGDLAVFDPPANWRARAAAPTAAPAQDMFREGAANWLTPAAHAHLAAAQRHSGGRRDPQLPPRGRRDPPTGLRRKVRPPPQLAKEGQLAKYSILYIVLAPRRPAPPPDWDLPPLGR
ncbi:hypothetical protein ASPACDRAFT_44523, partial [Aspergillus aculeatus ATCC 16872]